MDCQNGVWSSSLPQCKSKLIWNEYHELVVHIILWQSLYFRITTGDKKQRFDLPESAEKTNEIYMYMYKIGRENVQR